MGLPKKVSNAWAAHYTLCIMNWMSGVIDCDGIHQSVNGCQGLYVTHRRCRGRSPYKEYYCWTFVSRKIILFDGRTSCIKRLVKDSLEKKSNERFDTSSNNTCNCKQPMNK